MAIYTVENTSAIGKPCRVFDADGNELLKVTWCNTKTGEVERFKLIGDKLVTSKYNELELVRVFVPAPLRIAQPLHESDN